MFNLFLIYLLSQLLSDFVFQPEHLVEKKQSIDTKESLPALTIHASIFFVISLAGLMLVKGGVTPSLVLWTLTLAISHFAIDLLKVICLKKYKLGELSNQNKKNNQWYNTNLLIFLINQFLHITLVVIVSMAYYGKLHLLENIVPLGQFLNTFYPLISQQTFDETEKILMSLCLLIFATTFSNNFIKQSLSSMKFKLSENQEEVKIGRYIGSVERLLTVAAVLAGAYQALAALYASKTAIRFNQTKDRPEFGEYFILGTSISALFGILAGYALKLIWLYR